MRRSRPLRQRTPLRQGEDALKRQKPLRVGKPPKRRAKPLKSTRRPVLDRAASEAWAKGVRAKPCAACGKTHRKHGVVVRGHHVLRQQVLRRIAQSTAKATGEDPDELAQRFLWDARNRFPCCEACHAAHHASGVRRRRIPLAKVMAACPKLPQLVRELGPEAATELRKEYST